MDAGQRSWQGVTLGGVTDDYQIKTEAGLEDLLVRSATSPLPRYHGDIPGDHTAGGKVITLELIWHLPNNCPPGAAEALAYAARALFTVSRETQFPYGFQHSFGEEGLVFARVLRRSHVRSVRTEHFGYFEMAVQLEVTDPALYSALLSTAILTPFVEAGGFSWDAVWPINWGSSGAGGGVIVVNSGEFETWPLFMINGPSSGTLTNPIIENVTTGQRLALNANGGVSIASGQTLVISTHPVDRYIRFTTGASRYGKLSTDSEFFALQPGPNELRFRASGDVTGATVDVQYRSAWL